MYPMSYVEPVFRPPSEWKSLILQVTNGCSWNKCTFCDIYDDKAFDSEFESKPLEFFLPMVQRVMARPRKTIFNGIKDI